MKKGRIVILLLCVLLLVAGCGKDKKNSQSSKNDAQSVAMDVANYVFRGESIDVATKDGENISASIARGDKLYVMTTEWKYDDSGMYEEDMIMPKAELDERAEVATEGTDDAEQVLVAKPG